MEIFYRKPEVFRKPEIYYRELQILTLNFLPYLHHTFIPFWHTMMILHICVDDDPRMTSIDFSVKRSKVMVRFRVWSMHCFRIVTILLLFWPTIVVATVDFDPRITLKIAPYHDYDVARPFCWWTRESTNQMTEMDSNNQSDCSRKDITNDNSCIFIRKKANDWGVDYLIVKWPLRVLLALFHIHDVLLCN